MKKNSISIAVTLVMLTLSHQTVAQGFCNGQTTIALLGSGEQNDFVMDSTMCYELPALATGNNFEMLNGSKLSVAGVLNDSTVNSGAEMYVNKNYNIAWDPYDPDAPATASNITVNTGGLVRVHDGGTLIDSTLEGGKAYITNGGDVDDAGKGINITVNNGGALYVYRGSLDESRSGGISQGTIINNGGVEHLQTQGISRNAVVNNGGKQMLTTNSRAENTTIKSGALQQIQRDAIAVGSLIEEGGKQYVIDDGFADNTEVWGMQYVFNNNTTYTPGKATNTRVYGSGQQTLLSGGSATNVELFNQSTQTIQANSFAEHVTIHQQAKSWLAASASLLGTTIVNDQGQLQLTAAAANTGAYAESVGLNSHDATLLVIANTADTDSAHVGQLQGSGQVRFFAATDATSGQPIYSQLNVDQLSGNLHFYFNTGIEAGRGDYLRLQQASGDHQLSVLDSGAEITKPNEKSLDLITDESSGAQFQLANLNGVNINAIDGGAYMYSLQQRQDNQSTIWYLSAATGTPPVTTPSTDAVLSLSTTPSLLFLNDLDNLRTRRGELRDQTEKSGLWGRATATKNTVDAEHVNYKLEQTGFTAGIDKDFELARGIAFIGVAGSYQNASAKHLRGGTSKITDFSIAAYASYLDNNGFYVDGTLKFSRFDNKLRAQSTNQLPIQGDYNQNAYGAALEVGYYKDLTDKAWAEPYAQISYVKVGGQDLTLNNGMRAHIDSHTSLSTELGASIGSTIKLDGSRTIRPYAKAAWVHDFSDRNHVDINQLHDFSTDLSGSRVKLGLGINANFADKLSLFSEVNYATGSKVDMPIKVSFGLRYAY